MQKEYYDELLEKYDVEDRYLNLLTQIQDVLEAMGLIDDVYINETILGKAVLSYFEDIDRLKAYEGIERTNVSKIYGYEAYWILRFKPISYLPDVDINPKKLHINEKVMVTIMIAKMLEEMSINPDDYNDRLLDFMKLLFYNFKYRTVTQKTLELMISAFFCGCKFVKVSI